MMENQSDLQKEFRASAILAGAMMASMIIYAGTVEAMKYYYKPFTGFSPQAVAQVKEFYLLIVLFVFVAIRKVRSRLLKKEKGDTPQTLSRRLKTATIVSFALGEIPTIVGLVLFLTAGMEKEFYLLLACSVVIMVLYFPRYRHWEAFMGSTSSFY